METLFVRQQEFALRKRARKSADFLVIGDDYVLPEGKPADKNEMRPTTGDSFGIVYYDAAKAWIEH